MSEHEILTPLPALPGRHRAPARLRLLFAAATSLLLACAAEVEEQDTIVAAAPQALTASDRWFGAHCQDIFQGSPPWVTNLGWGDCNNFVSEASKQATKKFYYDLKGKKYFWETGGDQATNSLETVDLFYSNTHGGAWEADTADYAMWEDGNADYNQRVFTRNMTLGDEGRRLSIFATVACHTTEWNWDDDNGNGTTDTWERWDSVFSGGLKAALGSNGDIYYDTVTGKTFAQYLNAGYTIKLAWYYGMAASSAKHDVSVIFTGSSEGNCFSRRDGMTWNNFKESAYGRITNPPWMCNTTWNDV